MVADPEFSAWLTHKTWGNIVRFCRVLAFVIPAAAMAVDIPYYQQGKLFEFPYAALLAWHVIAEIVVVSYVILDRAPLLDRARSRLVDLFSVLVVVLSTWIGLVTWFIVQDFSIYALGCVFTAAVISSAKDIRRPMYAFSVLIVLGVIAATVPDVPTLVNRATNPVCVAIVCFMLDRYTFERNVELYREKRQVEIERARADRVLYNVLPESIADELKLTSRVNAAKFENMAVLFADIVGFTRFSSGLPPDELVRVLDRIFSSFDELVERHRLEKIKTIGDAYMVAANNDTSRLVQLALEMLEAIQSHNRESGSEFSLRIGIHAGPTVGGVIGVKRFLYDVWGDTVNIASRMESTGIPGRIQVSEAVHAQLAGRFAFEARGPVEVKGKGSMNTYFVTAAA